VIGHAFGVAVRHALEFGPTLLVADFYSAADCRPDAAPPTAGLLSRAHTRRSRIISSQLRSRLSSVSGAVDPPTVSATNH